jgi:hypothetical protein
MGSQKKKRRAKEGLWEIEFSWGGIIFDYK